jgi:hypothetical protein
MKVTYHSWLRYEHFRDHRYRMPNAPTSGPIPVLKLDEAGRKAAERHTEQYRRARANGRTLEMD